MPASTSALAFGVWRSSDTTVTAHDPETWGADTSPALKVHRLAVAQASRGRGLGHELLSWASARAAHQRKTFTRLDRADDNHGLRRDRVRRRPYSEVQR